MKNFENYFWKCFQKFETNCSTFLPSRFHRWCFCIFYLISKLFIIILPNWLLSFWSKLDSLKNHKKFIHTQFCTFMHPHEDDNNFLNTCLSVYSNVNTWRRIKHEIPAFKMKTYLRDMEKLYHWILTIIKYPLTRKLNSFKINNMHSVFMYFFASCSHERYSAN